MATSAQLALPLVTPLAALIARARAGRETGAAPIVDQLTPNTANLPRGSVPAKGENGGGLRALNPRGRLPGIAGSKSSKHPLGHATGLVPSGNPPFGSPVTYFSLNPP